MLVMLTASFGYSDERINPTVEWLVSQQLGAGGWNCETIRSGSRHGSFHTSISVLDALLAFRSTGGAVPVEDSLLSSGLTWLGSHHAVGFAFFTQDAAESAGHGITGTTQPQFCDPLQPHKLQSAFASPVS